MPIIIPIIPIPPTPIPYTICIPNIFTPNGDRDNEVFKITGTAIKEFEIEIYNRWGIKVYNWQGINGYWDGNNNTGIPAPDGVYYYIIHLVTRENEAKEYKGFLQLNR